MNVRTRNRLLRGLVTLALFGLLVLAWTQRDRFAPLDAGSRAPEFALPTLTGEPFSVSGARGKVLVLNVWATWCIPCREEMPALERLHEQLGSQGLEVVGVSTDTEGDTPGPFGQKGGDVREFVQQYGITFPIVHDPKRSIEPIYLVQGLPTTFVIDKNGRIVRKELGPRKWDDAHNLQYFRKLLSE